MVKAKDYIKRLHEEEEELGLEKALSHMLISMFEEITALGKSRKIQTDDAFRAIVREQEEKWRAMCRLDKRFVEDGFLKAFDHQFPMLKDPIRGGER